MKAENQENQTILETIAQIPASSAWRRGVKTYALELVEAAESPLTTENLWESILNGARDWHEYSKGGRALVYDVDIATRLCTPAVLKRKRGGELPPSSGETWLDAQTRALWQAERLIKRALRRASLVAA